MSQSTIELSQQAEARTQETRTFIRQVRAATRRKYRPEEKIRIVLEGFRRESTVNDLCRREGIKPGAFYAWTKDFMEAGKERLSRDTVRDATRQEVEGLGRENRELKHLVGELSLELQRLGHFPALPRGQLLKPSLLHGYLICWQWCLPHLFCPSSSLSACDGAEHPRLGQGIPRTYPARQRTRMP